jgi:hypothetical protein
MSAAFLQVNVFRNILVLQQPFFKRRESLSASANAVSVNLSHALSAAEKTLGITCTFAFFPFNNIFS